MLLIFSYLPAESLCRGASVCYTWYILLEDYLLWNERLNSDMLLWNPLGHTTNPIMYREAGCHPKDM